MCVGIGVGDIPSVGKKATVLFSFWWLVLRGAGGSGHTTLPLWSQSCPRSSHLMIIRITVVKSGCPFWGEHLLCARCCTRQSTLHPTWYYLCFYRWRNQGLERLDILLQVMPPPEQQRWGWRSQPNVSSAQTLSSNPTSDDSSNQTGRILQVSLEASQIFWFGWDLVPQQCIPAGCPGCLHRLVSLDSLHRGLGCTHDA